MKPKALLIDIDGVLRIGESEIIPGALEAVKFLKENKIPHLFVSNGTRSSRETVAKQLNSIGLDISEGELFTAPIATIDFINSVKPGARIFLMAEGDTAKDFERADIRVTKKEEPVDFVVIGYDRNFTYDTLSIAFRLVMNGAKLVAMNVDKIFQREEGPFPATGISVVGLEYCTGETAKITGKPNKTFFEIALKKLGTKPEETAIVGDFLDGDIIGGKNAGLMGILVKTGSYNEEALEKSETKPDLILDSIKDLPRKIS
jgi:HAD superfamily hydrolase (TIGR01458 family)